MCSKLVSRCNSQHNLGGGGGVIYVHTTRKRIFTVIIYFDVHIGSEYYEENGYGCSLDLLMTLY